jgi:hypothetical protein
VKAKLLPLAEIEQTADLIDLETRHHDRLDGARAARIAGRGLELRRRGNLLAQIRRRVYQRPSLAIH